MKKFILNIIVIVLISALVTFSLKESRDPNAPTPEDVLWATDYNLVKIDIEKQVPFPVNMVQIVALDHDGKQIKSAGAIGDYEGYSNGEPIKGFIRFAYKVEDDDLVGRYWANGITGYIKFKDIFKEWDGSQTTSRPNLEGNLFKVIKVGGSNKKVGECAVIAIKLNGERPQ